MTHDWGVLVGLIPLLRAFLAMVIIVRWLVSENRMRRLFFAYIFTVVVFTYISGLVFYDYEVLVNPKLHGFGNALWWAWMNVTTVGAEIFPVTAVGKVFCVLLPSLGMMFFPILNLPAVVTAGRLKLPEQRYFTLFGTRGSVRTGRRSRSTRSAAHAVPGRRRRAASAAG